MQYTLKSGDPAALRTACLVLGVFSRNRLSDPARRFDKAVGGALAKQLRRGDFNGDGGDELLLYDLPGAACERLLLIGLGDPKAYDLAAYRKACAQAAKALDRAHPIEALSALPATPPDDCDDYRAVREAVTASELALYRFEQCKSERKKRKRPLKRLALLIDGKRGARRAGERAIDHGSAIANGVRTARDLGNLPGNLCTPDYLAGQAKALGQRNKKLSVKVLSERQMERLGMGALLSVSRGSRQPAKLILLEYRGGKPKQKPVVLVGKGLTFDAGGISLKPAQAMDEMKYDMCGGASVIGTLAACVELELPINLVGIVPASENLPDGDANKPGDIVTSLSGQTIEILNTDAEGRLILCDALTYAERYRPAAVIDIATLTGACVVALGEHASGLLGNDDKLADELLAAGSRSGDRAWRLPLWDDYQKQLDSNFADIANIGGKGAGTITAACFLSRFTKSFRWAHLDIASTAWKSGAEKGATGRPVPLLVEFLLRRCGQVEP